MNIATTTNRMGRREMLVGTAAAAAAGLVTHLGAPTPARAQRDKATFVLVPGAWAGSWAWRKVIPLLRAAGHEVYATTPTGLGDRVHLADPRIDLDAWVTDVVQVLEYEDLTDVVLVGHSFGGFIISGVAAQVPERLAQVVYLDALLPEADWPSAYDFWRYPDEGIGGDYRLGLEAGWPGFEIVTPGVEEWLRGMIADPADADWYLAKLVPQPLAVSATPVHLADPAALPHVYIYCTEGKGPAAEDDFMRIAERVRADPA
jgi:pimeloyl-ACP methyl ester carboxylesterase